MRFLLLQSTIYHPAFGANKANRLLLEALASRGHSAAALCRISGIQSTTSTVELISTGARISSIQSDGTACFEMNGVNVCALGQMPRHAELCQRINDIHPDWLLVSSEDFGSRFLAAASTLLPMKTLYLARTTQLLPFGPRAFYHSSRAHDLLRHIRGTICVSMFVRNYVEQYGKISAVSFPLPSFSVETPPTFSSFGNGFVGFINPCEVKGISLFMTIAKAMPQCSFAVVPSWGTTSRDLTQLSDMTNVRILPANSNIDTILSRLSVLLVPSLWDEAFPKIVVESMARGIPVVASNVGGIPESKLGVDYIVPVQPIMEYTSDVDEKLNAVPHIPNQDIGPWISALTALTEDRATYTRVAKDSLHAARRYIAMATVDPFLAYIASLR